MPGFFDYDNPTHRATAIDIMVADLADAVDAHEKAAKAQLAAEEGGKKTADVTLKAMAAMMDDENPEHTDTCANVENFLGMLDSLKDDFVDNVTQGQEFAYAIAAMAAQAFADALTDIAHTWAPTYKEQTENYSDGDRVSPEKLVELRQTADAMFRAILDNVKQTSERQQDKSAQSLIEQVTGQEVKIREGEKGVQYLLKLTRLRRKQNVTPAGGSSQDLKYVLYVDGKRADGDTFPDQVRTAFGLSPEAFLTKVEDSAYKANGGKDRKWKWDTDYGIAHDGSVFIVRVAKES